jgi:hypothetical protein
LHKPSSSFLSVVVPIFFHYKSESVFVGFFLLEEDVGVFGTVVVPHRAQRRRRTHGGVSREKKEREKETSFLSFSNSLSLSKSALNAHTHTMHKG